MDSVSCAVYRTKNKKIKIRTCEKIFAQNLHMQKNICTDFRTFSKNLPHQQYEPQRSEKHIT
jgi:hypothetical protein